MSIPVAYLGIILIWSTTPLAIQWSTQGTSFALAVFARMLIGAVVAALIVLVWRIRFPLHDRARRAYVVGGLGLFSAMALTYWAARYVHSGLISVLFGLSPLMAGVLAALWLGERALTRLKVGGMLLGACGLAVIFIHGDSLGGEHALAGLANTLVVKEQIILRIEDYLSDNNVEVPDDWQRMVERMLFKRTRKVPAGVPERVRVDGKQRAVRVLGKPSAAIFTSTETVVQEVLLNGAVTRQIRSSGQVVSFPQKRG